jgi:hypothetical protein
MRRNAKGSLTIFAVLSIVLIAAFLFVLLEAGRTQQIRMVAKMNTESVLESVFANYERPMWENYQLLVLDNGSTEDQGAFAAWEWYAKELSEENVSTGGSDRGNNYLKMGVEDVRFEEYRLITDDDGMTYITAISQYMKANLAESVIERMMSEYQSLRNMDASETSDSSAIIRADQAVEEAKRQEEASEAEASEKEDIETESKEETSEKEDNGMESEEEEAGPEAEEPDQAETVDNPLQIVKDLWSSGVLKLVLKDTGSVSDAEMSMSNTVSKRTLKKGNMQTAVQTEFLDHVLFSQYLVEHFACYTQGNAAGKLQYELEYLLCGKEKDADNLCAAVERLLAVREAANMIALSGNLQKQEVAYSAALALVGATANPAIIYAVKSGLLSAWALAESILDVRTLLAGGKIAVIKSDSQWTTDLLHLGNSFGDFGKAVNCSNGLSYQQYLGFLLTVNVKKSAYRAMDLQETAIRVMEGYEDFFMDNMVTDAKMSVDYCYRSIFFGMDGLTDRMQRVFNITAQAGMSYRKEGA